jgi:flagellar biosynthetic protein FlhB
MADEAPGEKTHAPTAKRLKDAAEKGDVLRSRELAVAVTMLLAAAFLTAGGPWLLNGLMRVMRIGFIFDRAAIDDFNPSRMASTALWLMAPPVLVLGLLMSAAAVLTQLGPSPGGRFMMANAAPKFSRLNPMAGFKRMFGPNGWIEVGKGLLKLVLLGGIAWYWAGSRIEPMLELGAVGLAGQLDFAWNALTSLLFQLSGGLIIIALFDFPINGCAARRLRMSLEEIKEENKQQEGSPEAKGAQKRRQRQIAMGAIATAMAKAQFVVTNPTHFAVALAYDPAVASALCRGQGTRGKGAGDPRTGHGKGVAMHGISRPCPFHLLHHPRTTDDPRGTLHRGRGGTVLYLCPQTRRKPRRTHD